MTNQSPIKRFFDGGPLDGSKTYLTAFAMILVGVGSLVLEYVEGRQVLSSETAVGLIFGGLSVFGIGHKLDKTL